MIGRSASVPAMMLTLSACASMPGAPNAPTSAPAAAIAWSVGPCFGFCPVFSARVTAKGRVTFAGQRHTAVLGARSRDAGAAAYRAVAAALARYRPAAATAAEPSCPIRVSDQPQVRIVWTAPDGRQTMLDHDRGCRSPQGRALDRAIDGLPARLGIADWTRQTTRPGVPRG